ncbi:MAG: hypothetical protein L7S55_01965 [Luminiphilus sp.]|jgi:hypothetical protein|nr:hypothetical protein [Luminiphilus sp.]
MNSSVLREKLLAAEIVYLRDQIINQLCRWQRCRDDRDLLMALTTVEELVAVENDN